LERQAPGLQVAFAGGRLHGDQLRPAAAQQDTVDIRQLPTRWVDPVEVGVAGRLESLGRGPAGIDPRLQAGQVRVVETEHAVAPMVERRPILEADGLGLGVEGLAVTVGRVITLQDMGRPIDEQGAGRRQGGQKVRIWRFPAKADGQGVEDLETRRHAVRQHRAWRSRRRQLRVVGDILPPETEVLGGEGSAVRPAMAGTQLQGEAASFDDFHAGKDIGDQPVILVPHHQPRVPEHDQVARIAAAAHQDFQGAAIAPLLPVLAPRQVAPRLRRQALGHGRQLPRRDQDLEDRRFLGGQAGGRQRQAEKEDQAGEGARHNGRESHGPFYATCGRLLKTLRRRRWGKTAGGRPG
jgi:hypothetical protein